MAVGIPALLWGGLLLSAVGTGVSAYSSFAAADQQKDAASKAKKMAAEKAEQLRQRGAQEAELYRAEGNRRKARQRLLVGGSGLTTDSFFDVLVDSAVTEEFAAQRVANQYDLSASEEVQSGALEASASRRRARALVLGGTTQFVSGVGGLATQYGSYKAQGYLD